MLVNFHWNCKWPPTNRQPIRSHLSQFPSKVHRFTGEPPSPDQNLFVIVIIIIITITTIDSELIASLEDFGSLDRKWKTHCTALPVYVWVLRSSLNSNFTTTTTTLLYLPPNWIFIREVFYDSAVSYVLLTCVLCYLVQYIDDIIVYHDGYTFIYAVKSRQNWKSKLYKTALLNIDVNNTTFCLHFWLKKTSIYRIVFILHFTTQNDKGTQQDDVVVVVDTGFILKYSSSV